MTTHSPEQIQREADRLTEAVNRFATVMGLQIDGLPIVDVLVVAGQRGFDEQGGRSRAFTMVPTDSPNYTVMGLIRDAQIEYDRRSWQAHPDYDED